jgi:hypothetical protein
MNPRKTGMQPVIRVAPPGELNVYPVYEHQLDQLAQGSPASLLLNFALFFLGVAATAAGTLWSAPPDRDRTYYTFVIILLITLIAGVVMLVIWWFLHTSTRTLIANIKSQMPPNPAIREDAGEVTSGEAV